MGQCDLGETSFKFEISLLGLVASVVDFDPKIVLVLSLKQLRKEKRKSDQNSESIFFHGLNPKQQPKLRVRILRMILRVSKFRLSGN
jgi:hypothetical protein